MANSEKMIELIKRLTRAGVTLYTANCEADRAQRQYLAQGMDGDYDTLCDQLLKVEKAKSEFFAACEEEESNG